MRLIPQALNPRPKLDRIAISQEEITADLLYPSKGRRPRGDAPPERRRRPRR